MKKFSLILLLLISANVNADVHIPLGKNSYMDLGGIDQEDLDNDEVYQKMQESIYGFYKDHPDLQAALSRYNPDKFKHPLEEKMEKCSASAPLLGSDGNCYSCDTNFASLGLYVNMFPETAKMRCSDYLFYQISG